MADPNPEMPTQDGFQPPTIDHAIGKTEAGSVAQNFSFDGQTGQFTPNPEATGFFESRNPAVGSDQDGEPIREVIPGYHVLGVLGKGGMGVVYKARQLKVDRLVAMKVMRRKDDDDTAGRERFDTEAQAVARMQHPNIVQVYEVGEVVGCPFFTLEFADGGTLEQKIRSQLPGDQEIAALMTTLARAMQYAHDRNIIHRDLKPANILLQKDGTPKIADFGLARKLETNSRLTIAGTVMGTPSFMAPEQASGDPDSVGPPADVYSLGAIIYQLLTGRPPFVGSNVIETLRQVREDEPVSPRTMRSSVPRDLETICLKCLQKDPAKRYSNAAALADDLTRYQDGRPILARPLGPVARVVRWARRNPAPAGLIAVSMLAAIGGIASAFTINNDRKRISDQKDDILRINGEVTHQRDLATGRLDAYRNAVSDFANVSVTLFEGSLLAGQTQRDFYEMTLKLLKDSRGHADVGSAADWGQMTLALRQGEWWLAQRDREDDEKVFKEANAEFEKAKTIALSVEATEERERDKAAENVAAVLERQGRLAADRRDFEKAEKLYGEAISRLRRIVDAPTTGEITSSQARIHLGRALTMLARVQRDRESRSQAKTTIVEALGMLKPAVAEAPEDRRGFQARQFLALAHLEQGQLAEDAEELPAARESYAEAVRIYEDLVKKNPNDFGFRKKLAFIANLQGDLLLTRLNDPKGAREQYTIALRQVRGMLNVPEVLELQHTGVGLGYYSLAIATEKAGDKTAAARYYARSLEEREGYVRDMREKPSVKSNPDLLLLPLVEQMLIQARVGKRSEAIIGAGTLLKRAADPARIDVPNLTLEKLKISAACGYALASVHAPDAKTKTEDLAKALNIVTEAIREGYRDVDYLKYDPDLDPLRELPEFKTVLMAVERK
ncbi:serine/threonine-protein kinase [Zavarzinella formosa]|uniref:serine/threonine-protein kinase n=1 Tax=Zavarzinella formosa TaxID=360055 RepID=UPI0002F0C537|nr:serine/threonine-protein kinase [Zavarzinella formosa]